MDPRWLCAVAAVLRYVHTGIVLFILFGTVYMFIDRDWALIQGYAAGTVLFFNIVCNGKCPLSICEEMLLRLAGREQPVGEGFVAYYMRRMGIRLPVWVWDALIWTLLIFNVVVATIILDR